MISTVVIYDKNKKYRIQFHPHSCVDICTKFNEILHKSDVEPPMTIQFYDRDNKLIFTLFYSYNGYYYSKDGVEFNFLSGLDIFERNRYLVAQFLEEIIHHYM